MTHVRRWTEADLPRLTGIHALSFPRQGNSSDWIAANLRSDPKVIGYVAHVDAGVSGYIFWTQKSGFRVDVVLELEQLAVHPDQRRQGIAQALIVESLAMVRAELDLRGATLKSVMVTTRIDNAAQALYRRALGAEVEAVIADLYSADKVLMISRDPARWHGQS